MCHGARRERGGSQQPHLPFISLVFIHFSFQPLFSLSYSPPLCILDFPNWCKLWSLGEDPPSYPAGPSAYHLLPSGKPGNSRCLHPLPHFTFLPSKQEAGFQPDISHHFHLRFHACSQKKSQSASTHN